MESGLERTKGRDILSNSIGYAGVSAAVRVYLQNLYLEDDVKMMICAFLEQIDNPMLEDVSLAAIYTMEWSPMRRQTQHV